MELEVFMHLCLCFLFASSKGPHRLGFILFASMLTIAELKLGET